MNHALSRLTLTSLIIVAGAAIVGAQTTTTGSITGRVVDGSGAPVVGAIIRATSSQTARVVTSDADGSFRLGLLTAGSWRLTATATGYQTSNMPAVQVSVNANSPINLKMAKVSGATVEVVAQQAALDQSSTTTGMNTSMAALESIPMGRDVASVAFLTPGVVTGQQQTWSNNAKGLDTSIGGASGAENTWIIDGLDTSDMRYGGRGASLVPEFVDQVEVQTGGFKPEYSALGGVFNVVTKSGTNEFSGSAWFTVDPSGMATKKQTNKYLGQQTPQPARYDVGFAVGGPIIKDKLFYFIGIDGNYQDAKGATNSSGFTSDDQKTATFQYLAKVNWYLTQDQQLTFSMNYNPSTVKQPTDYQYAGSAYGDRNVGGNIDTVYNNYSLVYDATLTPNLTLHVMGGESFTRNTQEPTSVTPEVLDYSWWSEGGNGLLNGGTPPNGDAATLYERGGIGTWSQEHDTTEQLNADITWVLGSHNIKAGFSHVWSQYKSTSVWGDNTPGSSNYSPGGTGFYTINYAPGYRGYSTPAFDDPRQSRTIMSELYVTPQATGRVDAKYEALFLQDSWEVVKNLTVFYGGRFESQAQYDSHGNQILKFSKGSQYIQPRFGFTWDATGDGKTKIQGSYAMYYERMPQRLAIREFAGEQYAKWTYAMTNYNANNPLSSTIDYNSGNNPGALAYQQANDMGPYAGNALAHVDYGAAFNYPYIEDGIKLPRRTEYILGGTHSFGDGWVVGAHWKYRRLEHIIEDSVIFNDGDVTKGAVDPSPNGYATLWNPQPGGVYWNGVTRDPLTGQITNNYGKLGTPVSGYPTAYNAYRSLDFSLEKRWENDYINMAWTHSKLDGNYEGVVSSSNGQPDGNITASYDFPPYVGTGLLPLDVKDKISFYGSHTMLIGTGKLNIGLRYSWATGTPISMFDDGTYTATGKLAGTSLDGTAGGPQTLTQWANEPSTYAGRAAAKTALAILDPGGYGNATAANLKLGQFGRTPDVQETDFHLDYTFTVGKVTVVPAMDIFNLFNQQPATVVNYLSTNQNADPNNIPWKTPQFYAAPKYYRFGVRVRF